MACIKLVDHQPLAVDENCKPHHLYDTCARCCRRHYCVDVVVGIATAFGTVLATQKQSSSIPCLVPLWLSSALRSTTDIATNQRLRTPARTHADAHPATTRDNERTTCTDFDHEFRSSVKERQSQPARKLATWLTHSGVRSNRQSHLSQRATPSPGEYFGQHPARREDRRRPPRRWCPGTPSCKPLTFPQSARTQGFHHRDPSDYFIIRQHTWLHLVLINSKLYVLLQLLLLAWTW